MSLSQPKLKNPCSKFIEFKAGSDMGHFQYWNKEKEENVILKFPITFIVLDELSTITGFNDSTQSGIYSNEVHSLSNQVLSVRTFKGGIKFDGLYADIKPRITELGGKFCKSVYVALINGDDIELANLQLKGISFKAWMDRKEGSCFKVSECIDGKKGNIKYKIPVYAACDASKDLMDQARAMDEMLQMYLKAYESNNITVEKDSNEHEEADDGKQESPKDEDLF